MRRRIGRTFARPGYLRRKSPRYLLYGLWAEISPNGRKIAFSRFSTTDLGADGTGTFQLFVADSSGANEVCLSAHIPTVHVGMAHWDTTGKWLIVTRENPGGTFAHTTSHSGKGIGCNIWAIDLSDWDNPVWHQLTDYDNTTLGDPLPTGPFGALQARINHAGTKIAWSRKIGFDVDPANFSFWDIAVADWAVVDGTPTISNEVNYTPGSGNFYEVWDWSNDDQYLIIASDAGHDIAAYMDAMVWQVGTGTLVNMTGANLSWDEQTFFSPDNSRVAICSSRANFLAYDPYNLWERWFTDIWVANPAAGWQSAHRLTHLNVPEHSEYFPRAEGTTVRAIPSQWHQNGTLVIQLAPNTGDVQNHEDSQIWVLNSRGLYQSQAEATVVIQPDGAVSDGDVMIVSATPTTNYVTNALVVVGDYTAAASAGYRGLFWFDLSGIPADKIIQSVKLELYESAAADTAALGSWAVTLYGVTAEWVAAEATWNNRKTGTAWTAAGGGQNVLPTYLAYVTMDGTAASAFVSWQSIRMRDWVQDMITGGNTNYGFMLMAPAAEFRGVGPTAGNAFVSSNGATASQRPKLTIVYKDAL